MKLLIQQNNQLNIAPIINTIKNALVNTCEIGFFSNDVDINQVVSYIKPDVILYYDTEFSKIERLISKLRCIKLEHVSDMGSGSSNYEFSLTNPRHSNFLYPACNTFILNDLSVKDEFVSDISYLGPPLNKAIENLSQLISLDCPYNFRIYGANKYYNWRYCGTIHDDNISHIYSSSKCVPIFHSTDIYDTRVLDCAYARCIPIVEHNEQLLKHIPDVEPFVFHSSDELYTKITLAVESPDKFTASLEKLRKAVIANHTWYDRCSYIMKQVNLPQTASIIQRAKKGQVR